jgi:hypothetical protein
LVVGVLLVVIGALLSPQAMLVLLLLLPLLQQLPAHAMLGWYHHYQFFQALA